MYLYMRFYFKGDVMVFMGGKKSLTKYLLPIILENREDGQDYHEPFVGGANIIDSVDGSRYGSDNNKYLIAMWKALQQGWIPPSEISREFYSECRESYNKDNANKEVWHIIGYIGFNGSYGGRFFDGGYAGITESKTKVIRNYPLEKYKNIMKQIPNIKDVVFNYSDYRDVVFEKNSIIYCDIQYKGTKQYKSAKDFNYDEFWQWAKDKTLEGHTVFVSEYQAPDDWECVWEKEVSSSLRANSVISGNKKSTEKLFRLKV